jgi:hypothetical protein
MSLKEIQEMSNAAQLASSMRKTGSNISEMYRMCNVDVNEAILDTLNARVLNITTPYSGILQVETATAAGTVTADPGGNATATVTSKIVTGSPLAVSVALLLNDDANAIASKIRAALQATAAITDRFTVSGATDKVILTALAAADNDTTLNIAIAAGTATGVTAASTSANTIQGALHELVHLSPLFFPHGWNGWKIWAGYTPFDGAIADYENICIGVSDDNVTWTIPDGLTNPIEPKPATGFTADPCLFMSPDEKIMYVVFKHSYTDGVNTRSDTYLRSTTDGVNWTEKVLLFTNIFEDVSYAVVWDGDCYKMWTVKHADTPNNFYIRTSPDALTWSEPVLCTYVLPAGVEPWHMDVRKIGNQYHMLLHIVGNTALYFGKSDDGLAWTFGANPVVSDSGFLYKSAMFPMITGEGLKYGVYRGKIPYKFYYSELSFDRTAQAIKASNEANLNILCAKDKIEPWIFGDTFNRADDATGLGTSDSGHVWTDAAGTLGILNGKCYAPAAENSRFTHDLGISDFYAEIVCSITGTGKSGYLLFRYVDGGNFWRFGHVNGSLSLYRSVGYTAVDLKLASLIPDNALSAGDRIGVECDGEDISIYKNGIRLYSFTDSAHSTATKIGINIDNVATKFDNICAKAL